MGPTVDGFAVVAKEPLTPLHAGCRPLHTGGGSRHGAPAPRFSQLPPQPRGPPSSYANMGRPCWAQASPPAPGSVPPGKLQAVNRGWLCIEKAPLPLRERRTGLREPEMPAHTWHTWPRRRVLWGGPALASSCPRAWGPAAEDLSAPYPPKRTSTQGPGEVTALPPQSPEPRPVGRAAPEAARNTAGKQPTSIPDEYGYKHPPPSFSKPRSHPVKGSSPRPRGAYARNTRNKGKNPRILLTQKSTGWDAAPFTTNYGQSSSRREISQHPRVPTGQPCSQHQPEGAS